MAILTCPNCGIGVQPEDLICFRCGANLPHAPYPDDDIPSPTVSQQYIRPGDSGARRRPSLVLLRIAFPTGNVDVPAGTDRVKQFVQVTIGDGHWVSPWLSWLVQPKITRWPPQSGGPQELHHSGGHQPWPRSDSVRACLYVSLSRGKERDREAT